MCLYKQTYFCVCTYIHTSMHVHAYIFGLQVRELYSSILAFAAVTSEGSSPKWGVFGREFEG